MKIGDRSHFLLAFERSEETCGISPDALAVGVPTKTSGSSVAQAGLVLAYGVAMLEQQDSANMLRAGSVLLIMRD